MKADLFLLLAAACGVGILLYVFLGGLALRGVVRMLQLKGGRRHHPAAVAFWPVVTAAVLVSLAVAGAYRLSQWRPKRKSTLPGARVVKP